MADDMNEYDPSAGDISASDGGGNFLTKKLGPLPTWAWIAIGTVGGYFVISRMGKGSRTSNADSTPASGDTGDGMGGETGTVTDSSGNASDVLTAIESAMSLQAADIEALKAADKKDNARDKKQEKRLDADDKRDKDRHNKVKHKHVVHKSAPHGNVKATSRR
jgi:hypothetical protein